MAKCPAGSASADISLGGFFALFLILALLWLAYVAFSAYIKCALELNTCFPGPHLNSSRTLLLHLLLPFLRKEPVTALTLDSSESAGQSYS